MSAREGDTRGHEGRGRKERRRYRDDKRESFDGWEKGRKEGGKEGWRL